MTYRPMIWTAMAVLALALIHPLHAGEKALVIGADDEQIDWGPCPDFFPATCRIGVLHGDPAQPNVDIFFRVPAGAELPEHTHTSAERMVLVSGEMEITYRDQPTETIRTGDYAYGPPGLPHSATCLDAGDCVLFIGFEEPVDAEPTGEAQ